MVYFPGLNLLFPMNVIRNFGLFKSLVAFDLYQVRQLNGFFYDDVTPTQPKNEQLFIIGVKTTTFVLSSSTFLYFFWIMIFLMLVYSVLAIIITTRYIAFMDKI